MGSQKRGESYPASVSTGRTSSKVKIEVQRKQRNCWKKCDSGMGVIKDAQGPWGKEHVCTHSDSGVKTRLGAVSRSYMDLAPAQQASRKRKVLLSVALAQ